MTQDIKSSQIGRSAVFNDMSLNVTVRAENETEINKIADFTSLHKSTVSSLPRGDCHGYCDVTVIQSTPDPTGDRLRVTLRASLWTHEENFSVTFNILQCTGSTFKQQQQPYENICWQTVTQLLQNHNLSLIYHVRWSVASKPDCTVTNWFNISEHGAVGRLLPPSVCVTVRVHSLMCSTSGCSNKTVFSSTVIEKLTVTVPCTFVYLCYWNKSNSK